MCIRDRSSGETNCILSGFEDGTFRPDNNVTIIQLLKMAICSLGEDGYMAEAVENLSLIHISSDV